MIFCKFCGGKSQKQYLYLNCKHLSCLSCSFLRADFSSQEIECCDINTKIDQNSMEMIIKSKRFTRNQFEGNDNKYNYAPPIKDQKTQTLKEQNKIEQNASQKPIQRSKMSENKENLVIVSQNLQNNKQKDYQDEQQNEFGNILLKNLEQLKRYFQAQRMLLKQRQEAAIKDIVSFYTIQKQSITRPVSQKNLDKLHTLLSTKVSSVGLKNKNLNPQNVIKNTHQPKEPKQLKQTKQSHESYDHILKRLEVNQQRMKQKIQRHLQVLY